MSFWDVLRPSAPTKAGVAPPSATAAELRAALTEAEAATTLAAEHAARLAQNRADLLLTAGDSELDAADRELAVAQRAADRGGAAVAALQQKLVQAEEHERVAQLDGLFRDGQAALVRGRDIYQRYGATAAELARLIAQLPIVAAELERANAQLSKAGDPRRLSALDEAARPHRPGTTRFGRTALWSQIVLPAHDHAYSTIWPPHVHRDIVQLAPVQPTGPSRGRARTATPPGLR